MKIDCNKYVRTLRSLRPMLMSFADDPDQGVGEIAVSTMVPLIVVIEWAMLPQNMGSIPELVEAHARIKEFYGYTEIVPIDPELMKEFQ